MEKTKKKIFKFIRWLIIVLWGILEIATLFYLTDTFIGMKGLKEAALLLTLSILKHIMFALVLGMLVSIIIMKLSRKDILLKHIEKIVLPLILIIVILFMHSYKFNWYYKNENRRENQKVVLCKDFRLLYNLYSDIRSGNTKAFFADDYKFKQEGIKIEAKNSSLTKKTYYVTFSGDETDAFMRISWQDKYAVIYCMKPLERNKISLYEKSGFLAAINDEVKTVTREEAEMKIKEAEIKKEEFIYEKMKSMITITMDKNNVVTRTEPTDELDNMVWFITYNGKQDCARGCERELSFKAPKGRPGKYTIYVATFYRGKYLQISNIIEYSILPEVK